MPSQLFSEARSTARRETEIDALVAWIHGCSCPSPNHGSRVATNISSEAHLVGDETYGDPTALASVLLDLVDECSDGADSERIERYEAVARKHVGRGLRIPLDALPPVLYRYSMSRALLSRVVSRVLGTSARLDFDSSALSAEDALRLISLAWNSDRVATEPLLGRAEFVFATFDHGMGAPRHEAAKMADALALPRFGSSSEEVLFEMTYQKGAVIDHRFPTVCDAGWSELFRVADEVPPSEVQVETLCGWTEPQGGQPRQPEIVHQNAPLAVLLRPPRLVGRLK